MARKERGLSLDQVEQETKIRARYLEELERENFDVLPAVYVQGSLKTYANFLGLDGEALARELKRRQPLEDEPEAPTHVEPPKSDYFDRYLVSLGGAAGAETREIAEDEEMAGTAAVPADNRRLLVGSAAFLVLILAAIALALTLPRDSQPELSQLREPMTSQAPEVSRASSEEGESAYQQPRESEEQSSGDEEGDSSQPEQNAGPPAEEDEGGVPTGQTGQADPSPAQDPRDATADRQAPAAAEPETAPTTEPPSTTAPPPSTPAEAPIEDGATGVRADDPASQDDGAVVINAGGLRVSSGDGDSVEIRRGKGIKIRASGADDKDKDRR